MIAISLLFNLMIWSYTVEKETIVTNDGYYQNVVSLTCEADEAQYCLYACGNEAECYIPERDCYNCFSQSNLFLRILFTKLHDNFVVTDEVWQSGEHLVYLADENYILIDDQSIYNFFTAWDKEDMIADFTELCPPQEVSPILMVALNKEQKPKDIIAVICQDERGYSYALDIDSRFQQDVFIDNKQH